MLLKQSQELGKIEKKCNIKDPEGMLGCSTGDGGGEEERVSTGELESSFYL